MELYYIIQFFYVTNNNFFNTFIKFDLDSIILIKIKIIIIIFDSILINFYFMLC
jgi:hypothetical protein